MAEKAERSSTLAARELLARVDAVAESLVAEAKADPKGAAALLRKIGVPSRKRAR